MERTAATARPGIRSDLDPLVRITKGYEGPHNHCETGKEKEKEGLLPVRGLNILKADSRGRCIPCHADVVEDLVRRVAAPATKATFDWVCFPYFS